MGLFSFGGSKSSSGSRSESESFDNLDAFSSGFDSSRSESGGSSQDTVAFQDLFQQLFGGATGAAAGVDTGALAGASNLLFNTGGGFLETLSEGGEGASFIESQLAGGDDIVNEQIDLLGSDIEKFLTETVNPAITSRGVQAGTLGGGRGEVSRGIAGEGAVREFARGSTQIRAGERDRLDSLASTLLADESGRSTSGLASLAGLQGIAESGEFAGLAPFQALAQILGDPTVLGSSESSAIAEALGIDISRTTGRARSTSTSSSESEGKSVKFGFGGGG